jgi:hypothetical protein
VESQAQGWNTWNTRSVLSHVVLPEAFALNLGIKEYREGCYLKEALIGRQGKDEERIHPGPRTHGGDYAELNLKWRGIELLVQSGRDGEDLVLLVTPWENQLRPATLIVEAGVLWNRPGRVWRDGEMLLAECGEAMFRVQATVASNAEVNVAVQGPYLALTLDGPVGISTGRKRSTDEIAGILAREKDAHLEAVRRYGESSEVYSAVQTCLAWDTIYDPLHERIISPVSRIWNVNHGGYVLFCWDTYFAAYMASLDNPELANANAIAITRELVEAGFVPNFANPNMKSRDRSQPPVGSLVVRELYRRHGNRCLVDAVFDDLLTWNRWWWEHRRSGKFLCWGSDPYEPVVDNYWEKEGVNGRLGAALESGLDNSPMYDEVPFNPETHLLELADAGLMGLYGMDCDGLADLARVLGRSEEAEELTSRGDATREGLAELWDDSTGIYRNRRTDTGEFSARISPTNFYPLLCRAATPEQARRMVDEHLLNPQEFWGEWVLPSIARNDPAYPEQTYWRGRIWAPMNFLVYLGLRNYELPEVRAELSAKSAALLLKEWCEHGHVHENYNADSGEGCDKENSDRFYHWGGLLGLIALIEAGHVVGWEQPLEFKKKQFD